MPEYTIRPEGEISPGDGDWEGSWDDIDDEVDFHDDDGTFIRFFGTKGFIPTQPSGPTLSLTNPMLQAGDPTARQWTTVKLRVVSKQVGLSDGKIFVAVTHPQWNGPLGGFVTVELGGDIQEEPGTYTLYEAEIDAVDVLPFFSGGSNSQPAFNWTDVSGFRLSFGVIDAQYLDEHNITSVEVLLTFTGEGGGAGGDEELTWGDGVNEEVVIFEDTWTVSGDGVGTGPDNSISWDEEAVFDDDWTVTHTDGGGGGDIVPGDGGNPPARTDMACRSCGSMTQVTESLIMYADGFGPPLTWDGVSSSAVEIPDAKLLPYVVAHRDRVWLFGEEPYVTGTVSTSAGIAIITFSAAPPSTVLGKPIAISDAEFGPDKHCMATIVELNGSMATLSIAPDQTLSAAPFTIFSGTAGSTLQWSDENDHTAWTDPELPVGRLDGDIPTGAASVAGFLMLFKRQKTYRFDYGFDPNDLNDRALVVNSETRGLVAHKSCVVVEGSAYCMDQFGSGDGEAGWWVTRGGALFPIEIGGDISDVTAEGGPYQLDWSKSSCWFGVYEPRSNSIWWFCTKLGDNLPKIAFVYNRPTAEGGEEPGRWMVAEFDHPCIMGVTAVGGDGVMRAYVACADPDNEESIYLSALGNKYGDMATSSQNGVVAAKISNNVLDLGKHTELHIGSRVEINGERRTVAVDDTIQVTFTESWGLTDVENKAWRAGWKPTVTFKTIYISPDPGYTQTTIDQCHALFIRDNQNAELRIGFESDGNTQWFSVLGGAVDSRGTFANYERLVSMGIGVSGYEISLILQLLSPGGGSDQIHSVDILRRKRRESSTGYPSEMP